MEESIDNNELSEVFIERTISIKNMLCSCCARLIREDLAKINVEVTEISSGSARIRFKALEVAEDEIRMVITSLGMDIIQTRDQQIVENIKRAVFELVHDLNNVNSIVQRSDYIVEKLGMSYQYLSKLFSKIESLTLEKYIILHKIERIKELIDSEEYTLSEIAFMMDYSSVQYLSQQFRKFTGKTVSEYKHDENKSRKFIDQLLA